MVVVMVVAIMVVPATLHLILHIPINLLEQKGGKIEVMVTLLKMMNMKVAGLGEKGVFQTRVVPQMRIISNPFFQG